MKRSCLVSLLAMLSAAVLSGCAATAQGDLSAASPSADQASDGPAPTALPRHRARSGPRALSDLADPLLDAPYQTLVHCEAEDPLVSGEKLGSVRLICHSLRVSATLTEFRDGIQNSGRHQHHSLQRQPEKALLICDRRENL